MQHKVTLCIPERQKLENTKTGNRIAPTYLGRREEAAATAAGRDPPPHLGVVVDYKRRQLQQQDSREPWLRWEEEEEEEGWTKVGFLLKKKKKKKGEQRWVSSAPSSLAESPSPTPKTWSASHWFFGFLPLIVA
jgi:hypothetical protein